MLCRSPFREVNWTHGSWASSDDLTSTTSPSEEWTERIKSYCFSWNLTDLMLSKTLSRCDWMVWQSLAWPRISSSAGSETKKKRGNSNRFFSRYLHAESQKVRITLSEQNVVPPMGTKRNLGDDLTENYRKLLTCCSRFERSSDRNLRSFIQSFIFQYTYRIINHRAKFQQMASIHHVNESFDAHLFNWRNEQTDFLDNGAVA